MATYKTQQKEMLLDFLKKHPDTPFSVEELSDELASSSPSAPGKSTVYRLIGQLVDNGTVKRFVKGNSRQFLYQIAGGEECRHHLHLKCTECGKLLHMGHELSEKVLSNILGESDFTVKVDSTTLFGCCKDCKLKGETL
ncbi:MAG: transcriptional repressor [Clostridia bacterium]|nr:transcriptional repressor [Clostridia bacterium]